MSINQLDHARDKIYDSYLLGDRWVNRPWNNYINWTIIVVLFALSLLLAAQVILPNLFQ